MYTTLTIIRYKTIAIPLAFFSMALFRLPLWLNKKICFYKLMGSGKNGTFDKTPDLHQWAILAVHRYPPETLSEQKTIQELFGTFIDYWFRLFRCETFTLFLEPIEGHGLWDKKEVFGKFAKQHEHEGRIATLTRATIRLSKLSYFWKSVPAVAQNIATAKGFIISFGIGEIPWIKQATFSIWESRQDMKTFAYGLKEHSAVIKKTREQQWYSEDMFVRFSIKGTSGTIRGINPLERMG